MVRLTELDESEFIDMKTTVESMIIDYRSQLPANEEIEEEFEIADELITAIEAEYYDKDADFDGLYDIKSRFDS